MFITSNIEGATLKEKFEMEQIQNAGPRAPALISMLLPQDDQVWINYVNNWIKVKQTKGFFESAKADWGL